MPARVIGANFRDLSYITANMRQEDKAESTAVLGPLHYMDIAAIHLRDRAYVVEVDGNPEAAFGACRIAGDHLWAAWSFGTKRISRAIPIITRFCRDVMVPDLLATDAQRVEARALASHFTAHRWLSAMGASLRCELPCFGRGGETFLLYEWTRDVFQLEGPGAQAAPADTHDR
jgi:hypothetical protein